MRKIALVVITVFGLITFGRADNLTLSIYQNATNNLFQTSFPEKDRITSLAFAYGTSSHPFSFFTEGSYSFLYENSSISFYAQDIGLDYMITISKKTAFYLAAKVGGTIYRAGFGEFNLLSLGAIAAFKSYLSQSSILKLNYMFDYKKYRWSLFNYSSHLANLSLDQYFQTKTTLKGEFAWGYKHFFHPFVPQDAPITNPIYLHYGGKRGFGSGWGGNAGGGGLSLPSTGPESGLQIFSVSGLIAQGFGDRIGLKISGLRQWTLSGQNPFGSVDEFYLVENPTYDVFSWNGYALGAELTIETVWNTQIKIGYTASLKNFSGIDAKDLGGESLAILRQDRRHHWETRLEKNFSSVSIFLAYSYIKNYSNDLLFKWDGRFLRAGLEWTLNWGKNQ